MQKFLIRAAFLLLFSTAALAAVPKTFTAGTAAKATDVNANFAALDARIAALEAANNPLTAADVTGTYKVLGMSTSVGGNGTSENINAEVESNNASVTFTATSASGGTFSLLNGPRSRSSANCMNTNAQTNAQQSGSDSPHSHGYKVTDCGANVEDQAGGDTAMGTWILGPAANTITISPTDGQPLTAFISKRGGVGFAIEAEPTEDASNPGRRIQLNVFIRQ